MSQIIVIVPNPNLLQHRLLLMDIYQGFDPQPRDTQVAKFLLNWISKKVKKNPSLFDP